MSRWGLTMHARPIPLRVAIVGLVLLAIVPGFVVPYLWIGQTRQAGREHVEQALMSLARKVVGEHERLVEATRLLVTTLSQLPDVRERNGERCSTELARIVGQFPAYTNLLAIPPDGSPGCAARQSPFPITSRDSAWFQRAAASGGFSAGDFTIGPSTGRPVIAYATPIYDESGSLETVVAAIVDLGWLQESFAGLGLPPAARVTMVDSQGTIMLRHPPAPEWIGENVQTTPIGPYLSSGESEGVFEVAGVDRVSRVRAFSTTRPLPGDGAVRVIVDLPSDAIFAELDARARQHLLGLGAVALLALAAAWFGSDVVLLRQVRALLAATRRLEAGDLSARAGLSRPSNELGELGGAFDAMATRLQITIEALNADIAERMRAERAHAASEARLRVLVTSAMDAIVSVDEQQRIVLFNPAAEAMFGYTADQILGQRLDVLIPERFRAAHRGDMRRFGTTGETARGMGRQLPLAALRASGEEFPIEASISRATADGERLFSVIIRDVTERLQSERVLRQAERQVFELEKLQAIGQMAGGIAHNLNQALGLVGGYSELAREALRQSPPDLHACQEMLGIVADAAFAGGDTVKRLLTYAQSGDDSPFEPIDVPSFLDEVARLTAPRWRDAALADGRRIEMMISVAGRPVVRGRPADLREALTNLIFNAVDALPEGGSIHLLAEVQGAEAVIAVADTGIGMTAEVRQRMFEPFYTTKRERGTGLGMPTVARVVEQHEGRLEVDTASGQGTTIRLFLPVVADVAARRRAAPGATSPGAVQTIGQVAPLHVLAVDDDPALARMVALMLAPAGHTARIATSGEEALARLSQDTYDLVISDLSMGAGMDGWELASEIRQRWPATRVVLATGWGAAVDPERARALGIEAVISKPFRVAALDPLLRQPLARVDG